MIENFKKVAADRVNFPDEQVEIFFWLLVESLPEKVNDALKFLETHRNELAKKVARVFLEAFIEAKVI